MGMLEILYLFLAGTGAGLCLVVSLLGLLSPKERISTLSVSVVSGTLKRYAAVVQPYRSFFSPALGIGAACLVIGVLSLVCALGRPERMLGVLAFPYFTWANFGVFALIACVAFVGAQFLITSGLATVPFWTLRATEVLSIVFAFATALYTGLLLYDMSGVPFWHSAFLPVLFVVSSVSCGLGALFIISIVFRSLSQFETLISSMLRIDIFVIILEAAALACFMLVRLDAGEAQAAVAAAVETLVAGDLSVWFWLLLVGFGLVLPFSIELGNRFHGLRNLSLASAVLGISTMVGGATLRYCVVAAAMHPYLGVAVN